MPRSCTICSHGRRTEIERSLVAGEGVRPVAKRLKLSHPALQRHVTNCVSQAIATASEQRERSIANDLLGEIEKLQGITMELLGEARTAADLRTALRAVAQARGNLELLARMTGKLQPKEEAGVPGMVTWEEFVVLYKRRTEVVSQ